MDVGFDLYLDLNTGSDRGREFDDDAVVRIRITRAFLQYIQDMSDLVMRSDLLRVESDRFPGVDNVRCGADLPVRSIATIEGQQDFMLRIDNLGISTYWVELTTLLRVIAKVDGAEFEWDNAVFEWHGGHLLMTGRGAETFIERAEAAYPELRAAAAQQLMLDHIGREAACGALNDSGLARPKRRLV